MSGNEGGGAMPPPAPAPDIATKAEFDRLRESTPVPEPTLTPDAATTMAVNVQVHEENAQRAADLHARLERMRESFERDHALGQVNDKARADFDRAR